MNKLEHWKLQNILEDLKNESENIFKLYHNGVDITKIFYNWRDTVGLLLDHIFDEEISLFIFSWIDAENGLKIYRKNLDEVIFVLDSSEKMCDYLNSPKEERDNHEHEDF